MVALPVIVIITYFIFVPISAPPAMVRNHIFNELVTATDFYDARDRIEDNGWKVVREKSTQNVDKKSAFIYLGDYYSPFHTSVHAYLSFDENDKLIEVEMEYHIDSF